ncbi:peptidase M1-like protein [Capnocytophaga leadbetteri]|uniref:Peptidase M1-like protein n=1 Tax=Capnocytophaga leadbetteri TaxID=327575 RepID=A0A2T5XYM9_9FLAO|nr:M1 family metallopeptidase [Capnocytophaga leadbetteri]PTX08638.1 peptidase M1-like protein [Capnocytophaga leadbetteri]
MKKSILAICGLALALSAQAQDNHWQQQADYQMNVTMNVKNFQYKGVQKVTYINNSPDTLTTVFFHLYFNAFQPNSEMDANLQTLPDPDGRMATNVGTPQRPIYESRIAKLTPDEIGYLRVKKLTQDGVPATISHESTILKVTLPNPILPHSRTVLGLDFEGQVPVMIRRAGRNSPDGVALSMAQWYPKMVAYDHKGWHTTEYLGREFYGVWGNFDVKITLDKTYLVGASGVLQNPNEIGFGYEDKGVKVPTTKSATKTWHFIAERVHDFTWAADPQYIHDKHQLADGKTIHFIYKKYKDTWKQIQEPMLKVFDYYNQLVGKYPWPQYSFIQGGDGGMEYAMCTLMVGGEKYERLVGTAAHELAHAWFQHLLATDEAAYPWMDEGFTSYIEYLAEHQILKTKKTANPFESAYKGYFGLVKSGFQEPTITHSDRFATNYAYSVTAYYKGLLFLTQLDYLMGNEALQKTLKRYYNEYAFKNPTPNDFIRIAEKVSGMQLQWFLNEFMETDHTADYAISKVEGKGNKTEVTLKRVGRLPLSIDLWVTDKADNIRYVYVPLRMTYAEKPNTYPAYPRTVLPAWGWGNPTYTFTLDMPLEDIKSIALDPENKSVDTDKENNSFSK